MVEWKRALVKINSIEDLKEASKYINRIGAKPRSLLTAVVTEKIGNYWNDLFIIKFERNGDVKAPAGYGPNESEAAKIKEEFLSIDWPSPVYTNLKDKNLPLLYKEAPEADKFEFYDVEGNIIMLQVRKEQKGEKSYIPITKFSDGEYRFMEPEEQLPLWGLDQLKNNTTVFIHEGAKAARFAREIAEGKVPNHPWAMELANAAHLGFIGGALSPLRTNWSILAKKGVNRAYIVADNDAPGLSAVPKISKELNCPTFLVQFTDQFPSSFDLADEFPKSFFQKIGSVEYYTGPTFRQLLHPCTYMTKKILTVSEDGKKIKEIPVMREHAKGQWLYAEETQSFVCAEFPNIIRNAETLDAMLLPFSDVRKTSELILSSFTGRTPKFAYNPAFKGRKIVNDGITAINLYIEPDIKPSEGDFTPWIDYLTYLIPDEQERYEVMKWCATLIARPETRMTYALLMISEQTGTGKSTLGEILSQLVGKHNASFPTENEILEQFNGWLSKKRLVIVNEIYQGNSFKAANKLKSYITDDTITMRMMYKDGVSIDNYAHFLCCSNSIDALKLESNDRRWYIPVVTETTRSHEEWEKFFSWLNSGGYSIIYHWANQFGDYVKKGSRAPASKRKSEIILESRSVAEQMTLSLLETTSDKNSEVAFAINSLFDWATQDVKGTVYDKKSTLSKLCSRSGFTVWNSDMRLYIDGMLMPIVLSDKLAREVEGMDKAVAKKYVYEKVTSPAIYLSTI